MKQWSIYIFKGNIIRSLRNFSFIFFIAFCLTSIQTQAIAEDYPTKPITIYTPYAPGGGNDMAVRLLAEIGKEILGQPVVVANRPGGAAIIAQSIVAKEKPDGYTLAVTSDVSLLQVPQMQNVPFDPFNDFEFIIQFYSLASGFVCRSEKPWKSLSDLIEYSKKHQDELTYASPGRGGNDHIVTEYIALKEGVKWRMVPFSGSREAATALLGGHVDFGILSIQTFKPHVDTGEFRVLVIGGAGKSVLPKVTSLAELGYELTLLGGTFCIIAPKGTPAHIIKKLHDTFKKGMEDPRYDSLCKHLYGFSTYASGEEFLRNIKKEYPIRGKVLKALGLLKSK
jgi:tripartite-type tricarboxylate transporter receptor subunit TctC